MYETVKGKSSIPTAAHSSSLDNARSLTQLDFKRSSKKKNIMYNNVIINCTERDKRKHLQFIHH